MDCQGPRDGASHLDMRKILINRTTFTLSISGGLGGPGREEAVTIEEKGPHAGLLERQG